MEKGRSYEKEMLTRNNLLLTQDSCCKHVVAADNTRQETVINKR